MYTKSLATRTFIRRLASAADDGKRTLLDRPIGWPWPPKSTENDGVDRRTWKEMKEEMMDMDKNLARRKELEDELLKGFSDVRSFRRSDGKFWDAPSAYFRADKAGYMPNFWGKTLSSNWAPTTDILKGKTSIVRIYGALSGENQVKTFTENQDFPGVQIVDINMPDSGLKVKLVELFMGSLRKSIPEDQHDKYFLVRKGVTKELQKSIRCSNAYSGYVYLVDKECRIRWAGSGEATEQERQYLARFAQSVRREAEQKPQVSESAAS